MKRGDVYYAELNPTIGSEQGGRRPVVIIQNDLGNKHSTTVIVAMVTSQRKKQIPTHIPVGNAERLTRTSIIMAEQLRTIDKKRIGYYICTLNEETMEQLDKALKISLALNKEETETERKGEEAMSEIIRINNCDISLKEYNGQRVVTLKDIDAVHERPDGTAKRNFNTNKKRFVEGEDFFVVSPDEIRTSRLFPISDNDYMDKVLITESGYLMLVKSFTDDLAWDVQRKLVKSYFNRKKQMTPEEMMRVQLGMIDGHEERLTKLENTMNIDYGQQRVLGEEVAKVVIDALGGKMSNAYREMGKKVFAECNHDIKDFFNVNSRCNIPRLRFQDAVDYIGSWKPCTNTRFAIDECNRAGGEA